MDNAFFRGLIDKFYRYFYFFCSFAFLGIFNGIFIIFLTVGLTFLFLCPVLVFSLLTLLLACGYFSMLYCKKQHMPKDFFKKGLKSSSLNNKVTFYPQPL